jgi:hypothetical protein
MVEKLQIIVMYTPIIQKFLNDLQDDLQKSCRVQGIRPLPFYKPTIKLQIVINEIRTHISS